MSPTALATSTDILDADALDSDAADLLEDSDELLIEEISIDGMCGVY
jgi:mycofactocin precursor